jgi:TonB-dependent receptor
MASVSPAAAQTRTFDIPAQSAQQGIPQFAQQADLQLIAPAKLVAGQMTSAVQGTMSVQAGLKRLLRGTSLTPVTQSNGAILLTQAAVERVSVRSSASTDIVSAGDAAIEDAPAPATTAAPDQEQVVIVQGIRRSLSKARDIKRHAPNMVESIVAEDIGKMPDLNLAESIQRIPGVAMSREGGEGRNITLRGFGPDFTRTTLNGMEVPAGTDGLDSGGVTLNASRAFDFNVFASELFDRIDVEKTQRASTEEGGIAGTVDLYSAKPFDFDKDFTLSASAQASYNTLTEKSDPRLAFLVSKKFDGGKLGVLFSAAVSRRTVHQEGFASVRWTSPYINGDSWADTHPQVTGTPSDYCGAANALDCLWAPRLPRADFFGNDQKRVGFTGSVQYKPNQDVLITFDALHSELNNDRYNYNSMEWLLTHGEPGNFTGQTPLSFTVAPDGKQLIAASFDNVTSWYESRHQESKSSFDQYVLSGRFRINDYLTLNAMAGSAKDDADRTELRFYVRSIPHYYAYDYSANPYVATVSYGDYDPNDSSNYINALTNVNRINNVLKQNYTSKLSATYADDGFSLQAGVDYNNHKITYSEGYGDMPSFDPASYLTDFPYSDFGRGLGASLHTFQVMDFGAIAASNLISPGYAANVGGGWSVDEETIGGYVELNSEQRVGDMTLHTNAGVRVVRTNVTSDAVVGGTPVEVKHSYDNYLPSLNFALDVREDLVARLAYGRSMTRPNLATLNISGPVFSYDTRSVSNFGNPNLKPYESNDTDLSLEWYFGKTGLLALGVFNKNVVRSLKTEIVNQYIDPAYWPAIYADPRYDASYNADPATTKYTFSIPVNDETDQSVSGVELTYNQPFTFLPGAWKYLGVTSNFTHVSAKDSTGVSPNSYNFTVYYDTGRFGARISVNKRDDYLLSAPDGNGSLQEMKYGPTHIDLSSSYNLNDHVTLTFEGINITDEVERIYGTGDDGKMDLTREYSHTGAQWFLGVRYRY